VRDEFEVDDIGVMFGIGRMVAEAGQKVRVVVIVAYKARGIIAAALETVEDEERQLKWFLLSLVGFLLY
jgi:hypothetical protein